MWALNPPKFPVPDLTKRLFSPHFGVVAPTDAAPLAGRVYELAADRVLLQRGDFEAWLLYRGLGSS